MNESGKNYTSYLCILLSGCSLTYNDQFMLEPSPEYKLGFTVRIALMVLTDKIYTILNIYTTLICLLLLFLLCFKLTILPSLISVALFQLVMERLLCYPGFLSCGIRVVLILRHKLFSEDDELTA